MKQSQIVACLGFLLTSAIPIAAQAQWPPDSLVNLKVLPRDTKVRDLVGVMRGFAGALGVRCIYCHVGDDPSDLASTDFVSDDRVQKRKAREMIRMVQRINDELLANLPERSDPPVRVECATCHHGLTKPVDIRVVLTQTLNSHGPDSAIAEYQGLRERYYGSYSYDFRPFVLANVAERVARTKPDAALAVLEFNQGINPTDQQTYLLMAQIHMSRADTAAAVRTLEQAVGELPDNAFLRGLLRRVKGS